MRPIRLVVIVSSPVPSGDDETKMNVEKHESSLLKVVSDVGSTPTASTIFAFRQNQGNHSVIGTNMPIILDWPYNRYYYADMADLSYQSISDLQNLLGEQLQALRLSKNLDQISTAEKAGISEKALRNLEAGRGSTIESFLRVLKALDSLDGLELLVPKPAVSPLALLRSSKVRQRARRSPASAQGEAR